MVLGGLFSFLLVSCGLSVVSGKQLNSLSELLHNDNAPDMQILRNVRRQHQDHYVGHSRNLRDAIKPRDMVSTFYWDSDCTTPYIHSVTHGNICFGVEYDGGAYATKFGCVVDENNIVNYASYTFTSSDQCTENAVSAPYIAPILEDVDVRAGECVAIPSGNYMKMDCSGKDPYRDAYGLHALWFQTDQSKECHENSIKTNRAYIHRFFAAGECYAMSSTSSMYIVPGCVDRFHYQVRWDDSSSTCENLSTPIDVAVDIPCREDFEEDGTLIGYLKEFCVDEKTGPQK